MPKPYVANLAQCDIHMRLDSSSRPIIITHHSVDTAVVGDPVVIADAVFASFASAWATGLDTNLIIERAVVKLGVGGGADPLVGESTLPAVAGTTVMASAPSSSCVLIRKLSATGGKHGRGRVYLAHSVGESAWDESGVLGSTQLGDHQTRADDWHATLIAADVPMVLAYGTGAANETVIVVTALRAQALMAGQRRRIGR